MLLKNIAKNLSPTCNRRSFWFKRPPLKKQSVDHNSSTTVAQQKKLVKSYKRWKWISFKNRTRAKGGFLGSLLAGIGIPLIAKLLGGCHGENHDDEDNRLRMFESLLPLIDRGELDVSQSGNVLVIRSQPTKSGGTVIPALKYLLSGIKKKDQVFFYGQTAHPVKYLCWGLCCK